MIWGRVPIEIEVSWLIGLFVSTLGLIFQILIYILVPCSRKLDQKLLTQMTIARILNVVFEVLVVNVDIKIPAIRDSVFALYEQTDAALVCWMFVFTKNLYEKVINVFNKKTSFTIISVTIWLVTFPIGILCPLLLSLQLNNSEVKYYTTFYTVYAVIKFIVLTVNLVLFGVIFRVAIRRADRNVGILRTCLVSFILISVSSVQVFINDLLTLFLDEFSKVSLVFAVINSYQVIAITIIFVILVRGACGESLLKTITKKFIKETI